ncbi:MAG TPA: D-2-hydroxyacid dehydrogenase family protein [Thermoanaerobaculia bacterium]
MRVVIPDDYQDAVRGLDCFAKLAGHEVTVLRGPLDVFDAEALVLIRERSAITDELLAKLPALRLIAQTGRGTAHIDMEACRRRGVEVAVGTGSPYAPAELTFALMLAASRRICAEASSLRGGGWQTGLGRTLRGRTLGIWGYGKIGSLVAGFGRAFGMNVIAHGRSAPADGTAFEPDRARFLAAVDVLSLHLRLVEETRGIVRAADLARMKYDALLVNTARAELIEPGALAAALQAGRPGFAALDVFENEPAVNDPLPALDNVLATPHLGYVEKDSYELYFGQAFDAVNAFANRVSG